MDDSSSFPGDSAPNRDQTVNSEENQQESRDHSCVKSPRVLLHRIEDFVSKDTSRVRQTFPPLMEDKSLQKDAISAKVNKLKSEGYVKVSLFKERNRTKTDKKRELFKIHKISNPTEQLTTVKNSFNVKSSTKNKKDKKPVVSDNNASCGSGGETLEKRRHQSVSGSNSFFFSLNPSEYSFSPKTMALNSSKETLFQSPSELTTVLPRLANLTPGKCKSHTAAPSPDKRLPYSNFISPTTSLQRDQIIESNSMYKPIVYPNSCQITPKICYPRHSQSPDVESSDAIPRTKLSGWNLCYPTTDMTVNSGNNVCAPLNLQSEPTDWRKSIANVVEPRASFYKTVPQVETSSSVFSQQTGRPNQNFSGNKECNHYSSQRELTKYNITQSQYSPLSTYSTSYKLNHPKRNRPCSTNDFHSYKDVPTSPQSSDEQRNFVYKNYIKSSASVSSTCKGNDKSSISKTLQNESKFSQEYTQGDRLKYDSMYPGSSVSTSAIKENFAAQNYLHVTSTTLKPEHIIRPCSDAASATVSGTSDVEKIYAVSKIITEPKVTPQSSEIVTSVSDSSCIMCQNNKGLSGFIQRENSNPSAKPVVAWVEGQNAFIVHLPRCEPSDESLADNDTQFQSQDIDSSTTQDACSMKDEGFNINPISEEYSVPEMLNQNKQDDSELAKLPSIFSDTFEPIERHMPMKVSKTKCREPFAYQSAEISIPNLSAEATKNSLSSIAAKHTYSSNKLTVRKGSDDSFQTSYRLSRSDNSNKIQTNGYNVKTSEDNKDALSLNNETHSRSRSSNKKQIFKIDSETLQGVAANNITNAIAEETLSIAENLLYSKDADADKSICIEEETSNLPSRKKDKYISTNDMHTKSKSTHQSQQDVVKNTFRTQHQERLDSTPAPAYIMNNIPTTLAAVDYIRNTSTTSINSARKYIINTGDRYIVSALPVNTFSANAGTYLVNPVPVTLSVNGTNSYAFKQAQSSLSPIDRNRSTSGTITSTETASRIGIKCKESKTTSINNDGNSFVNFCHSGDELPSAGECTTRAEGVGTLPCQQPGADNCSVTPLPCNVMLPPSLDKKTIICIQRNEQCGQTNVKSGGSRVDGTPTMHAEIKNENSAQRVKEKHEMTSPSLETTDPQAKKTWDQRQCKSSANDSVIVTTPTPGRDTVLNIQRKNVSLLPASVSKNTHMVETTVKCVSADSSPSTTLNSNAALHSSLSTDKAQTTMTPRKVTQIKVVIPSMFSPTKQSKQLDKNHFKETDSGALNKMPDGKKLRCLAPQNKNNFNINAKDSISELKSSSKAQIFFKKLELKKVTQELPEVVSDGDKEAHKYKFKRYALCVSVRLSAISTDHAYSAVTIVTDPTNTMFEKMIYQTDLVVYIVYDEQKTIMVRSIITKYPLNPGLYYIEHTSMVKQLNNVVFEGAILKPCPHSTTIENTEQPLLAIGNIRIKWADACTDLVNQISTPVSKVAVERVLAETNSSAQRSSEFLKAMTENDFPVPVSSNRRRDTKRRREALDCRCLECRKLGTFIEYKISKMLKSKSSVAKADNNTIRRSLVSRQLNHRKSDLNVRSRSVNAFVNSRYSFSSTSRRGLFPRTIRSGSVITGTPSNDNGTRSKLSTKWRSKNGFRRSTRRQTTNKKYCTDCDDRSHVENVASFNQNSNNLYNFRHPGRPPLRSRRI